MALRRIWAFCMAGLTVFLIIACIPSVPVVSAGAQGPDHHLPLSLASPVGGRMYFLPSYDEVSSFTPERRLYVIPTVAIQEEVRILSGFCVVFEDCGQATDLCGIESITPRAP